MQKKYKMTGCAKFFIFLLFAIPAAYFASAYYHGEDGIGFIKEKIGLITSSDGSQNDLSEAREANLKALENQQQYEKTIQELNAKIKNLEMQLKAMEEEIKALKANEGTQN